jgi:hypothetical protein
MSTPVNFTFHSPPILDLFDFVGIHQAFTEGHGKLVLECCADYWNGTTLEPITETVEKKVTEFYQNALFSDMQVIAFAYRPLPNLKTYKTKTVFIENHDTSLSTSQIDLNAMNEGLKSRFAPRKPYSAVDSPLMCENVTGDDLSREALTGQTLLGMATLFYQPKPVSWQNGELTIRTNFQFPKNVIDFIEDLDLAGIRYVYFSGAPERESKGIVVSIVGIKT